MTNTARPRRRETRNPLRGRKRGETLIKKNFLTVMLQEGTLTARVKMDLDHSALQCPVCRRARREVVLRQAGWQASCPLAALKPGGK